MHLVTVFAFCASVLILVSGQEDVGCKNPAPVEKFVGAVYTALMLTNDQHFLQNFSIGGGEAGIHVFNVVKKVTSSNAHIH